MKVIGLVGPKTSGKDTLAAILTQLRRSDGKLSFAGPLKEICGKVFNLSYQQLNDVVLKEQPLAEKVILTKKHLRDINRLLDIYLPSVDAAGNLLYRNGSASITGLENRELTTPREILQIIGTNYIRDRVYRNWHLEAAFSPKALEGKEEGVYCITDVRFVNEYEYLRDRFGEDFVCYYIQRPEAEEKLAQATHPSELEVAKVLTMLPETQVIKNNGTLDDLKAIAKELALPKEAKTQGTKKKSRFVYAKKA